MKNKKKKPTNKDIIQALSSITMALEALQYHVQQGDKALDQYIIMKGDKETFIEYLIDKAELAKDDKDTKKTEDQ